MKKIYGMIIIGILFLTSQFLGVFALNVPTINIIEQGDTFLTIDFSHPIGDMGSQIEIHVDSTLPIPSGNYDHNHVFDLIDLTVLTDYTIIVRSVQVDTFEFSDWVSYDIETMAHPPFIENFTINPEHVYITICVPIEYYDESTLFYEYDVVGGSSPTTDNMFVGESGICNGIPHGVVSFVINTEEAQEYYFDYWILLDFGVGTSAIQTETFLTPRYVTYSVTPLTTYIPPESLLHGFTKVTETNGTYSVVFGSSGLASFNIIEQYPELGVSEYDYFYNTVWGVEGFEQSWPTGGNFYPDMVIKHPFVDPLYIVGGYSAVEPQRLPIFGVPINNTINENLLDITGNLSMSYDGRLIVSYHHMTHTNVLVFDIDPLHLPYSHIHRPSNWTSQYGNIPYLNTTNIWSVEFHPTDSKYIAAGLNGAGTDTYIMYSNYNFMSSFYTETVSDLYWFGNYELVMDLEFHPYLNYFIAVTTSDVSSTFDIHLFYINESTNSIELKHTETVPSGNYNSSITWHPHGHLLLYNNNHNIYLSPTPNSSNVFFEFKDETLIVLDIDFVATDDMTLPIFSSCGNYLIGVGTTFPIQGWHVEMIGLYEPIVEYQYGGYDSLIYSVYNPHNFAVTLYVDDTLGLNSYEYTINALDTLHIGLYGLEPDEEYTFNFQLVENDNVSKIIQDTQSTSLSSISYDYNIVTPTLHYTDEPIKLEFFQYEVPFQPEVAIYLRKINYLGDHFGAWNLLPISSEGVIETSLVVPTTMTRGLAYDIYDATNNIILRTGFVMEKPHSVFYTKEDTITGHGLIGEPQYNISNPTNNEFYLHDRNNYEKSLYNQWFTLHYKLTNNNEIALINVPFSTTVFMLDIVGNEMPLEGYIILSSNDNVPPFIDLGELPYTMPYLQDGVYYPVTNTPELIVGESVIIYSPTSHIWDFTLNKNTVRYGSSQGFTFSLHESVLSFYNSYSYYDFVAPQSYNYLVDNVLPIKEVYIVSYPIQQSGSVRLEINSSLTGLFLGVRSNLFEFRLTETYNTAPKLGVDGVLNNILDFFGFNDSFMKMLFVMFVCIIILITLVLLKTPLWVSLVNLGIVLSFFTLIGFVPVWVILLMVVLGVLLLAVGTYQIFGGGKE